MASAGVIEPEVSELLPAAVWWVLLLGPFLDTLLLLLLLVPPRPAEEAFSSRNMGRAPVPGEPSSSPVIWLTAWNMLVEKKCVLRFLCPLTLSPPEKGVHTSDNDRSAVESYFTRAPHTKQAGRGGPEVVCERWKHKTHRACDRVGGGFYWYFLCKGRTRFKASRFSVPHAVLNLKNTVAAAEELAQKGGSLQSFSPTCSLLAVALLFGCLGLLWRASRRSWGVPPP